MNCEWRGMRENARYIDRFAQRLSLKLDINSMALTYEAGCLAVLRAADYFDSFMNLKTASLSMVFLIFAGNHSD